MKKLALALIMLSLAGTASAEVNCSGEVTRLDLLLVSGTVVMGIKGGPNAAHMCSVKDGSVINDVPSSVCKVLYSSLLSAKAAGKKATFRFYDHDECTTSDMSWKPAGRLGWSSHML